MNPRTLFLPLLSRSLSSNSFQSAWRFSSPLEATRSYSSANKKRGRQRYKPGAVKQKTQRKNNNEQNKRAIEVVLPPPPSTTDSNDGPFPSYFTCRHTYEDTLMEELELLAPDSTFSSPFPGCVRMEETQIYDAQRDASWLDPAYALQTLPNCHVIQGQGSIKSLAKAIEKEATLMKPLLKAPKGSLRIHALVPGVGKGQRDPILMRRSQLVADALREMIRKNYRACRQPSTNTESGLSHQMTQEIRQHASTAPDETWLLQILLLSADVAAASLVQCQTTNKDNSCLWPNPHHIGGIAKVDIDTRMPSSAYRKLLEALACLQTKPSPDDIVVDLGASPGGWTAALLLHCQCNVVAVDRSSLDPGLMQHQKVQFISGDAFSYRPPSPVAWMVSDLIAYPERVAELLDVWCGKQLAHSMVVTVKFQGTSPSWEALQVATTVAKSHGYGVRTKHFFNNKNEVTLLITSNQTPRNAASFGSFYEISWPKRKNN